MQRKKTMASKWFRENVHAWSVEMKKLVLTEYPELPLETKRQSANFPKVIKDVQSYYVNDTANQNKLQAIYQKLTTRANTIDNDIGALCIGGLFVMVWELIDTKDTTALAHFKDTLLDMGLTCVQGDSHRLFSTYVALKRASKK